MRLPFFMLMFMLLPCLTAKSQSEEIITQKASFNGADLAMYLSKSALYPQTCLARNIQGDVILSYNITKEGILDSIMIISSPDPAFSTSAVSAIVSLDQKWKPTTINNIPVSKKYLTVFRYRMYMNSAPVDYTKDILKSIEKEKYEKGLKLCNDAIKENKYDYALYKYRAQIKTKLGDLEGAEKDHLTSMGINDQLMVYINISAMGVSRRVSTGYEVTKISR
jgi:hypothetical protein